MSYQFQYEWYDPLHKLWRNQWEPLRDSLEMSKADKTYLEDHFPQSIRNIKIMHVEEVKL